MTQAAKIIAVIDALQNSSTEENFDAWLHNAGFKLARIDESIDHERMTWQKWRGMMDVRWFDGWSFTRFGVRAGKDGDVVFPAGFTRGSFGLFSRLARYFDAFGTPSQTLHPIHHLVHLRSGVIIGSFDHDATAVEAAELADRVADWTHAIEPGDVFYRAAVARSAEAWSAVAILSNSERSARPNETNDLIQGIVMKMEKYLDQGRPEKLS